MKLRLLATTLLLASCAATPVSSASQSQLPSFSSSSSTISTTPSISKESQTMKQLIARIDENALPIQWENNASVDALKDAIEEGPITVKLQKHGGFEQWGSLGRSFPSNDHSMVTSYGDVVLYNSFNIVLFYGSNSWAYTKLGHINLSQEELTSLLGNEAKTLVLELK